MQNTTKTLANSHKQDPCQDYPRLISRVNLNYGIDGIEQGIPGNPKDYYSTTLHSTFFSNTMLLAKANAALQCLVKH